MQGIPGQLNVIIKEHRHTTNLVIEMRQSSKGKQRKNGGSILDHSAPDKQYDKWLVGHHTWPWECLLLCDVSDDRCIGFSFVRWLFGGCMVGLLAALFVPYVVVVLGDAWPLSLSPCNTWPW